MQDQDQEASTDDDVRTAQRADFRRAFVLLEMLNLQLQTLQTDSSALWQSLTKNGSALASARVPKELMEAIHSLSGAVHHVGSALDLAHRASLPAATERDDA